MRYNILFGGAAGQGPNILTHILGETLVKRGYYVFYARDYQSLIRGGHNFNVLTFAEHPVNSNDKMLDIIVALDENTKELHKSDLKKEGKILDGKHPNMYFAGMLFKLLGLDFTSLEEELKKLSKFEENLKDAKSGYEKGETSFQIGEPKENSNLFMNGNQGISEGAKKSGIDIYYAYPMTPATPILNELAANQIEDNILVLELENEISVINTGIGSAMTGAKVMVGTSGGGFDLMTEGLSLTGIAEVPMVIYLSQRPGPATGVATYTGQGDFNLARHAGHGEFTRMVLAPGDSIESEELTNQAFYFSQKYKVPVILLGDKHLAESFYTSEKNGKIISVKRSTELRRYNSYEMDKEGVATEDPEIIKKEIERRQKKEKDLIKESENFEKYKIYGNEDSQNVVVSWGSTKGAIIDAIKGLDVKFVQVLYVEPFPENIKSELEGKNIVLIENNSTGMLGSLIAEKTCIKIEKKILKYDGRPFLADELKKEIEENLK